MITRLYTIYDKLAEETGPVFQAKNDQVAYRQFQTQLSTIQNIKADDFTLLCVGEYENIRIELQTMLPIEITEQIVNQLNEIQKKPLYETYGERAGKEKKNG